MKHFTVVVLSHTNSLQKEGFGCNVRECYETNSEVRARDAAKQLAAVNSNCEVHIMESKQIFVVGNPPVVRKAFNADGELVPL